MAESIVPPPSQHSLMMSAAPQGNDEHGGELDDLAQRLHDVGPHLAIDLGLVVDLGRVVVGTHGRDARHARTGADEATRVELIAGLLGHEIGLRR